MATKFSLDKIPTTNNYGIFSVQEYFVGNERFDQIIIHPDFQRPLKNGGQFESLLTKQKVKKSGDN